MATIETYINKGVARIVLGTEAIRNPDLVIHAARAFPECIVVGIDARDG
jgi:phosphoribosylformimino-5-aminoimidazole carboxamide ribotide isomerase